VAELQLHTTLVAAVFVLAVPTLIALLFINAPYGRYVRQGWGPTMPARVGWVVMESPAVLLFIGIYAQGQYAQELAPMVLLGLWQLHYINRTFIYPLRIRAGARRMPVVVALMAIVFNCLNAYINARWISHFGAYPASWLSGTAFTAGAALFLGGWLINQHADRVLISLRKPGESGYGIPEGGLYRWVSSPNYLGEILTWVGWAVASWSVAGLAFAVFTTANLLPRALANHRWYRENFAAYPPSRRALIPYIL
jgi:protein-S-isoprenylcysteine O-methyltransferase Ste14